MENNMEELIAQLALRVRLFRDSRGKEPSVKGLSERELSFLEYIDMKGDTSFSILSSFFKNISASTVSNTMKKLYKKGLIIRKEDPEDLRTIIISITEEGTRILEQIKKERMHIFEMIVLALKLEEVEERVLYKVIPKAIRNFDEWI